MSGALFLSDILAQRSKILTIIGLGHRLCKFKELILLDPSVVPCDLFETSDHAA